MPPVAAAPQDVVSGVAKLAPSLASAEALASGLPAAVVNGVAKLPTGGLPQAALTEVAKLAPSIVAAPQGVVNVVASQAPTVAQLAGRGDEAVAQAVSFTRAVGPLLGIPASGATHVIATQALPTERSRAAAAGPSTTSPTGASGPTGALALTTPASTAVAPNPPAGAVTTLPGAISDAAETDRRGAQTTGSAGTRASWSAAGSLAATLPALAFASRATGSPTSRSATGVRSGLAAPATSAPSGTPASAAGSSSTGFSLTLILVGLLALGAAWAWRRMSLAEFSGDRRRFSYMPDRPG